MTKKERITAWLYRTFDAITPRLAWDHENRTLLQKCAFPFVLTWFLVAFVFVAMLAAATGQWRRIFGGPET